MADNVAITAGTGTTVATDEVTISATPVQVQYVKVLDGTADSINRHVVDSAGRANMNIGGSASSIPTVSQALTASAAATVTGTASTTGTAVADVSAAGNVSFHLQATAFVGTVTFEQSLDSAGGTNTWATVPVQPEDTASQPITSLAINTAVAFVRQFTIPMFGPALFRVRCSAFTSGSLTAFIKPGPGFYEGQPALAPSTSNIGTVDLGAATAGTTSSVTLSGTANTNTTPVAADATRKGLVLWNNNAAANILINFGTTATTSTVFAVKLLPGQGYEVPGWASKLAVQAQANVASATVVVNSGTGL